MTESIPQTVIEVPNTDNQVEQHTVQNTENGVHNDKLQSNAENGVHDADSGSEVSVPADADVDEDILLATESTPTKPKHKHKSSDYNTADVGDNALDRLDYLLMKTEQFATLVKPKQAQQSSTQQTSASKRTLDEKRKEQLEDAELLQNEQSDIDQSDTVLQAYKNPDCVKAVMRDYQLEALNWMLRLHHGKINGILADEMGLGKTLMSLSLLQFLKHCGNYPGPHLVIVPKSTLVNWSREVERWTHLSVLSFHGNQEERTALYERLGTTDVCITTYEMIIREKTQFKKTQWHYVIIDEAHRIKNEKSLLSRVVRTIPSQHRLLITGTPLQNNLHEMWALLNFLVPTLFDSSDDFDQWFDITDTQQQQLVIQRLHRILRPFLLRRLKSDVEKSLPPKTETKLFVSLTAMQRQWYTKLLERDIELLNATAGSAGKTRLLNIVMQLRKVCNHPYLFFGAEPGPPYIEGEHIIENAGKMVLLDKLLQRLREKGSRVLIFSQMTRMLDILEDYMRYRDYDYCRIDGQTKHDEREIAMDEYNAPNSKKFAFLLSTRAGGLGINLQTADTVILYDSDWNPQMDLQAQDRAHRIGQKKPVFVYRFVTEHTVEQKIVERALKKLFLDTVVIKQGRLIDADKSMSATELQNMVKYGVQDLFAGKSIDNNSDDIDTILQRGANITSEEQNKLKQSFNNNLLSFDNTDEQSSLVFEGVDYRSIRNENSSAPIARFIEPPKRQRKTNYSEQQYFHSALYGTTGEHNKAIKIKEYKPAQRYDFQFFNIDRLEQLERKEWEFHYNYAELKRKKREAEKEQRRIQRENEIFERRQAKKLAAKKTDSDDVQSVKTESTVPNNESNVQHNDNDTTMKVETIDNNSNNNVTNNTVDTADNSNNTLRLPLKQEQNNSTDSTETADRSVDASPEPPESDVDEDNESVDNNNNNTADDTALRTEAGELTEEEKQEKQQLLQEGFVDWSKRDFQSFIKASEKYGRNDIEKIADAVNKSVDEVQQYHTVFWQKYKQIENYDKIIQTIEKGEDRLQKLKEIQQCISRKIERTGDDILDNMTIQYNTAQKSFTELEDKFLIYALHVCGYSNWSDIKRMICRSYIFRYDWYIKSRINQELAQRAQYLVKLLQKEEELIQQQKLEAEKKAKAAEARKRAAEKKKLEAANKSPSKVTDTGSKKKSSESKKSDKSDKGKPSKSAKTDKDKSSTKGDKKVKSKDIKSESKKHKSDNKENKSKSSDKSTDHKRKQSLMVESGSDDESLALKKAKVEHDKSIKPSKSDKHHTDKSHKSNDNNKQQNKDNKTKTPNKSHHDDKSTKKIDTFFKKDPTPHKSQSNDDDIQILSNKQSKATPERQSSTDSNNNKNASPSSTKQSLNLKKIPKKNEFTF